jgi:glycosyltransferase involved in cell wall biosynthesis
VFKVAYFANQFPSAVEPYVGEEIRELNRLQVPVIPGSVRRPIPIARQSGDLPDPEILCLQPLRAWTLLQAIGLAFRSLRRISGLLRRVIFGGHETPLCRFKALLHTWLGAYYALRLQNRGVEHIHVHHGYFASWIAMVAARLLGIGYSVTLHGSDLLLHGNYLDTKLGNCKFCVTISEYNRAYILQHFPEVDPAKIVVSRLGVDLPEPQSLRTKANTTRDFTLLAVGRLHPVKDHAFLIKACAKLRDRGLDFGCVFAGEGPERLRLEELIRKNQLQNHITMLGHVPREEMDAHYRRADVVVLTSRSEGIPLVLMEAMARGRLVLAPAITGIPELVIAGKTGFLYMPGVVEDFVARILFLHETLFREKYRAVNRLDWIRHAARVQVTHNFNREKNLHHFSHQFLRRIADRDTEDKDRSVASEDPVLQQIQLSL